MTQEEADLYWSTRTHKKWVVSLLARRTLLKTVDGQVRRLPSRHNMHVCARTRAGAIRCALDNAPASNTWSVDGARLATAHDLGCVLVERAAA